MSDTPSTDGSGATVGGTTGRHTELFAAAGLLGAVASSSCCIVPLGLFATGVSGAWIANLTALEPYQPIFIVATVAMLAVGWRLASRRKAGCAPGGSCAVVPLRYVRLALWVATALVASAIAFPYVAPSLLPS